MCTPSQIGRFFSFGKKFRLGALTREVEVGTLLLSYMRSEGRSRRSRWDAVSFDSDWEGT